jgi:hypothetical protein
MTTPASSQWWVFAVASLSDPSTSSPDYIQAATAAAAEAATGKGNTTPPVGGPFATKADAQAWVTGPGAQYFGAGKTNVAPPSDLPVTAGTPGLSNPLAALGWLQDIGHWFGVAVTALTDKSTWISVGWLLLGLVLVIIALLILAKRTDLLPSAVPVPVPV